jgi:hypothetical protein
MKTKKEHIDRLNHAERGNALIYVLIAIALFGALSFTLSRQTGTSEVTSLSAEKAQLVISQMASYSGQTKSAVDQMLFTAATNINELDFTPPGDATFDTGTVIHKVYHPQGGGLNPARLPQEAVNQVTTDPMPGWYLGRFNNIDWTRTAADDVILVAFQISEDLCNRINASIDETITTPPSATVQLRNILIDDALHGGTNVELTTDGGEICPDCHNRGSLCIENAGIYAYYSVIADQ